MPRIKDLPNALTAAQLANDDVFVVEDISANEVKRLPRTEVMLTNDLGWAAYKDTTYTTSSRLTVSPGSDTVLPNNSGSVVGSFSPPDIANLYDGTVITGIQGEGRLITVEMKLEPQTGANYMDMWFDIGGSVGEIYRRTVAFPKGSGAEYNHVSTTAVYTLDTWEANGATVYVRPDGGNVEIWNIRYVIHRTSKV